MDVIVGEYQVLTFGKRDISVSALGNALALELFNDKVFTPKKFVEVTRPPVNVRRILYN
jgi:hypothetical protein